MEMVEYIEVDELSRMIRGSVIKKYPLSFSSGISASSDELEKLPAADVSPVRHGRWRCHGDCGVTECSVCLEH